MGLPIALSPHRPWIHYPAVVYVEFFRGVPLVMVIFWFWFIIPQITGASDSPSTPWH